MAETEVKSKRKLLKKEYNSGVEGLMIRTGENNEIQRKKRKKEHNTITI